MNRKLVSLLLLISLLFSHTVSAAQFRVLLFTKTAGWHHQSINPAVTAMQGLADKHSFALDWQEDASWINDEHLKKFDAIVFLSTTGDILNDKQQAAMERFIKSGKGFVGIHAAADTEYDWAWYHQLVGRSFVAHPDNQSTMVTVINRQLPGLERWPDEHLRTDEWYEFGPENIEGLRYLLTIDESTYNTHPSWAPETGNGMGEFHPIAWFHEFDGGRSFYTALGHIGATWTDELLLDHVYGGLYWAATGKGLRAEADQ